MLVEDFIILLQQQPPGVKVAYGKYSEQCLLKPEDLKIKELCEPREDGWVHDKRPDKPSENYLLLPGN